MGKKEKQLYAMLLQSIQDLKKPENNPAQNFLTTTAIDDANKLKNRDFSTMSGMFGSFVKPSEELTTYKNLINVGREGTFALGDSGGAAFAQKGQYLADKFARDSAAGYQQNISNAALNVQGALGQAAGAKGATDGNVVGALQGLYGAMPKSQPFNWGSLIGAGAQIGSSLIAKF